MKLVTTFTLRPIETGKTWNGQEPRHDMIVLGDPNNYPCAIFHIDTLAPKKGEGSDDGIFDALYKDGKTLKVRVTFEVID